MDPKTQIQQALVEALARAYPEAVLPSPETVQLTVPRQKEHGDLATNLALIQAKLLGKPPREVALALVAALEGNAAVERTEVAGPGFINLTVRQSASAAILHEIAAEGEGFGRGEAGKGQRVNIEFVSANPTGPLHVGHARGAVVGDAVARLLVANGYEVTREFYFNDAGVQMNLLGESLLARIRQQRGEAAEVPEKGYHGEYFVELAKKYVGESTNQPINESTALEYGGREIMAWIKRDLADLDIRFDVWTLERKFHDNEAVRGSLAKLRERGEIYELDGATFIASSKYGDEKDRVVIKGDGTFTYLAPDIAYHEDKYGRGFTRLINVWGADHHGYVPRMKAAMQALGHDPKTLEVIIIQMVNILKGGEVQRLGKRLGNFITLRTMLDELGADVIRWFFLMRSADSDMTFDWELAQDHSDRNPVYKVQYAHARICSVFKQGEAREIVYQGLAAANLDLLSADEEQALLRHLAVYRERVRSAGETLEPHQITAYLLETANLYNAFQTLGRKDGKFRILRPDAPAETQARLALLDGVRQVLANGLRMLGISTPERM